MNEPAPTSTAGILLREWDTPEAALAYAERHRDRAARQANHWMFQTYDQAARELRAYLRELRK